MLFASILRPSPLNLCKHWHAQDKNEAGQPTNPRRQQKTKARVWTTKKASRKTKQTKTNEATMSGQPEVWGE